MWNSEPKTHLRKYIEIRFKPKTHLEDILKFKPRPDLGKYVDFQFSNQAPFEIHIYIYKYIYIHMDLNTKLQTQEPFGEEQLAWV